MAYRGLNDMTLTTQGSGETDSEGSLLPTSVAGSLVPYESPLPVSGISAWLQQNKTAVYVGAAVLVGMAMFGGGRRR